MIHTLEHVSDPQAVISQVKLLLSDSGMLLINVPDWTRNYYDLVVADHYFHFSQSTLIKILEICGLAVLSISHPVNTKEIAVLATHKTNLSTFGRGEIFDDYFLGLEQSVLILSRWVAFLRNLKNLDVVMAKREIAIYGLGIAGAWLLSVCELSGLSVSSIIEDNSEMRNYYFSGIRISSFDELIRKEQKMLVLLPFSEERVKEILNDRPFLDHYFLYFSDSLNDFILDNK
jgi:hypothetical protein